ncbi:MAG: nicotinate phosphoribosyltransferase [Candidatus Hydrogenedentota bacterium]
MTDGRDAWFRREGLALLTDFYQLTMMAGYLKEDRANNLVCFEYFFRGLPTHAGFGVACGLESFLSYLENLRFGDDDIAFLREQKLFDESFLTYLRTFEPRCAVRAIPEGTLVFPHEPIVQIEGPIFEAQLLETALLNMLNYQTLIATKAARVCLAAEGDPVMEFGLRRAHGPDGGVSASRAAHVGGCASTSNVLAGKVYGIPVAGTHAHSWVMSFPSEVEAFRAFARNYPQRCVLLVDTYDTIHSGVPNAIAVFNEMREAGIPVRPAIRLDSGDLAKLSKIAYRMMREAGFDDPLIVASNDLEEDLIADLKRQGAKINAWGVGTHLITASDCPSLNGVYKLVAIMENGTWQPRIKISSNAAKATNPAPKMLVRYFDRWNQPLGDVLFAEGETWPESGPVAGRDHDQPHREVQLRNAVRCEPLLVPVMERGRRIAPAESIGAIRKHAMDQIAALPDEYKRLRNPQIYRVILSERVGSLKDELMKGPDLP